MDFSNLAPSNISTSAPFLLGNQAKFFSDNQALLAQLSKPMGQQSPIQIADPFKILKITTRDPLELMKAQQFLARELEKAIEAQQLNPVHELSKKNQPEISIDVSKAPNPLSQMQKTIEGHQFAQEPFKMTNNVVQSQEANDTVFKKPFDPVIAPSGKVLRGMNNPPPAIYTPVGPFSSFATNNTPVDVVKTANPNYQPPKKSRGPYQRRKKREASPDIDVTEYLENKKRKIAMKEPPFPTAPTCQKEYEQMMANGWNMQMFATNQKEYEMLASSIINPQILSTPQLVKPVPLKPAMINATPFTADPVSLNINQKALTIQSLQTLEDNLVQILNEHGIPLSLFKYTTSSDDELDKYPIFKAYISGNAILTTIIGPLSQFVPDIPKPSAEETKQRYEEFRAHQKLYLNFENWKFGEAKKYIEVLHINTILKKKMAYIQMRNPYYIDQEYKRLLKLNTKGLKRHVHALTSLMRLNLSRSNLAMKVPSLLLDPDVFCMWLGHKVAPIRAKEHWLYTLPSIEQIKELMSEAVDNVAEEEVPEDHKTAFKLYFVGHWFHPNNGEVKKQHHRMMVEADSPAILRMYENAIAEVRKLIKEKKYYWSLDDEVPVIE